ncbi:MAG TPA: hypothetical protein PKE00_09745, partial [Planctomycetota bacterium]|nr:hypothetical protein [Planctomycetota bacterium]
MPASCATREGNRRMTVHFAEQRTRRIQILVDASQLAGLRGSRLVRLSFRKEVVAADMYERLRGGEVTPMVVNASFTDTKAASPSPVFRDNHGSNVVEVFRGTVTLPKVTSDEDRAVASFDAIEAPTLHFTQPLPIVAGKNLCLDFETYPASAGHAWEWPIDAEVHRVAGTARAIGQACWPADETPATSVMESSLRPGMHLK